MVLGSNRDLPSYRVTFFFGPEPVQGRPDVLACVFNVKKRSWKAGIQVSVDIAATQLSALQEAIQGCDPIRQALEPLSEDDRADA